MTEIGEVGNHGAWTKWLDEVGEKERVVKTCKKTALDCDDTMTADFRKRRKRNMDYMQDSGDDFFATFSSTSFEQGGEKRKKGAIRAVCAYESSL